MERSMIKGIPTKAANTVPAGKLAMGLVMFGEKQSHADSAQIDRFITCIFADDNPDANSGIFAVLTAFVCTLAAKASKLHRIFTVSKAPPIAA